jgi:membrane protein required for colicin V production
MVAIDVALIGIVVVSAIISIFRGFFREAFSLFSWVMAVWAAWKFGPQGAEYFSEWGTSVVRLWAARVVILIIVLFVGGVVNWMLGMLLHKTGLSGTDRVIGMIFGMARGVILVGILLLIMEELGYDETAWWWESKLIPYAAPVVDTLRYMAEDSRDFLDELDQPADPFNDF